MKEPQHTIHPSRINSKKKQEENTMPENIVRVHRPDLTAEERARRMKQIKEAAERLVADSAKRERTKIHNEVTA